MTNYCPNCNHEFAPDDTHCANCGQARPNSIKKLQTTILSQRPVIKAANSGIASTATPASAPAPLEAPVVETPVEETAELAETAEAAPAEVEKSFHTFWICAQCNSANPEDDDYCEMCGALNPKSQPTARQADLGSGDTTAKIPTDVIAALAADIHKPTGWTLVSGNGTDEGLTRKGNTNEDSHFLFEARRVFANRPESFGLYIVADGMGGQAAGEVASRLAIQSIAPIVISEVAGPWTAGEVLEEARVEEILSMAVTMAHNKIKQYNAAEGIDSGTTLTACCVVPPWAVFANVGDSRTYLFRPAEQPVEQPVEQPAAAETPVAALDTTEEITAKLADNNNALALDPLAAYVVPPDEIGLEGETEALGDRKTKTLSKAEPEPTPLKTPPAYSGLEVQRVTRDQSLVQHLMEQGEITLDEVYSDPRRNVILYALGAPEDVPVDTYHRDLKEGDIILLCSDGLWEMVRDDEIAKHIAAEPNLHECAKNLVNLANENGGADNITVVLTRMTQIGSKGV